MFGIIIIIIIIIIIRDVKIPRFRRTSRTPCFSIFFQISPCFVVVVVVVVVFLFGNY